jgi:hypothetical protein
MSKKAFISYLLLVAFLLMGTHNIIPHHHHEEGMTLPDHHSHQKDGHHHHNKHGKSNEHDDPSSLQHLLSLFNHSTHSLQIVFPSHSDFTKNVKIDKHFTCVFSIIFDFHLEPPDNVPIFYQSEVPHLIVYTSFSHRGPPISFLS